MLGPVLARAAEQAHEGRLAFVRDDGTKVVAVDGRQRAVSACSRAGTAAATRCVRSGRRADEADARRGGAACRLRGRRTRARARGGEDADAQPDRDADAGIINAPPEEKAAAALQQYLATATRAAYKCDPALEVPEVAQAAVRLRLSLRDRGHYLKFESLKAMRAYYEDVRSGARKVGGTPCTGPKWQRYPPETDGRLAFVRSGSEGNVIVFTEDEWEVVGTIRGNGASARAVCSVWQKTI